MSLAVLAACQGAAQLSSTQQELVTVTPLTFDFGSLEVGMTSAPRNINVNPSAGEQYDTVTAVTHSCPDFIVDAPGLPAEVYRECDYGGQIPAVGEASALPCTTIAYQNYTFTTNFRPNVGGATSCVVTITTNGTTNRTITLYGNGTIPPVRVDVAPASVAFGDVRRNTTSSAAQIMVRNLGGQNMTVSSVTASAGFSITSGPTSTTVGPNGSQPYAVVCQPSAVGGLNGSFVVNSNDPMRPSVTVPLSCNGIDSNLDISPSPLALPTTRVGEPVESNISLVNSGGAPMTIQNVTLTSDEIELVTAPNAGTVLGASGGTATARVRFAAATAATASGTLNITYDGGQTRTSQISARALTTSMALTPDGDVDLGPICLGQSKMQPFSIIANADGAFRITSVTPPDAPFSLMTPALPATVQGAGATTLMLNLTATPVQPGVVTSAMTVTSDIPNAAPKVINLSAIALGEGIGGTPEILDLGSQPLDMTTIGQEVSISNCTMAAATLANARIEGVDAASFAIVQQPASTALAPNGVAKWLVVFTPRSVGPKSAIFSVDHDGGTTSIMLAGEGLGSDVTGTGGGPPSYYACSAGAAGRNGLFGIVLALWFVTRRRRR